MADTGNRSSEIFITNDIGADLTVESASLGEASSWMSGEEAEAGNMLEEFQTMIVGVKTEEEGSAVSGSVTLGGFGDGPVRIEFGNNSNGQSFVNVTPNDRVKGEVEQVEGEEESHSKFRVQLQRL